MDQVSTRSLAITRYKRNHELMNEVFQYAAFGDPTRTSAVSTGHMPAPFSIFKEDEMAEKMVRRVSSSLHWLLPLFGYTK